MFGKAKQKDTEGEKLQQTHGHNTTDNNKQMNMYRLFHVHSICFARKYS